MFLLSYFRTPAEALHYALSEDGFSWHALNNNQPVLQGEIGSKTLRDPFVFQARDGRFHMLATNSWKSDSIVHARSEDLINWLPQRLLPVMQGVENVRNCWAPECFYDDEVRCYRLIWSSSVLPQNNDTDWNHRIWSCSTTDFETFSDSELFFDPGYSVIDATVLRLHDKYLMAFKDERGEHRQGTENKAIRVTEAVSGNGPWTNVSDLVTPTFTEGPSLYRKGSTLMMLYDHFLNDRFGISQSGDGHNWQVVKETTKFPETLRHAAVLEIEDELGQKLKAHWSEQSTLAARMNS